MQPILNVENLSINLRIGVEFKPLVQNLNFKIEPQKTLALLGETGSGKTLTALSILRLLSNDLFISKESQLNFLDQDLLLLSEVNMRKIRGSKIAMVFQEPSMAFNPVMTIGHQIEEVLKIHKNLSGSALKLEANRLLEMVQLNEVERVYRSYVHQLSGGMKQRAMIAMSLAGDPKLLIADEPTSALDVTTQDQILNLLKQLQAELGMSILFITHDLAVAAKMADEIAVMQHGKIVEQGATNIILHDAKHLYTQKLISALPTLEKPLVSAEHETLLIVEHLKIYFPIKKGIWSRTIGYFNAVDNVSFALKEGETLSIVGESGSGKTTLAKGIMSLIKPTSGEISILGKSLSKCSARQLRQLREDFQIIFQDPFSAMDPRFTIKEVIEEGMLALSIGSDATEREDRINYVLEQVGLKPEHKYRYPHQMSGGQRQRVCIARSLVVGPRLIVCDEPTSNVDRMVQAQLIDLFIQLQQEFEIAYVFITHNMDIVRAMAHQVAVMQAGKIVEYGSADKVLSAPEHPYTRELLRAKS
jgi:peptide/nickel transport system ATP-binding protein